MFTTLPLELFVCREVRAIFFKFVTFNILSLIFIAPRSLRITSFHMRALVLNGICSLLQRSCSRPWLVSVTSPCPSNASRLTRNDSLSHNLRSWRDVRNNRRGFCNRTSFHIPCRVLLQATGQDCTLVSSIKTPRCHLCLLWPNGHGHFARSCNF